MVMMVARDAFQMRHLLVAFPFDIDGQFPLQLLRANIMHNACAL